LLSVVYASILSQKSALGIAREDWRRVLRQIGQVLSYADLIDLIRGRIAELQTTCESVGALAGLADGHLKTIVAANGSKTLGSMSFTAILNTLSIKLVAYIDDQEHEQRYAHRLAKAKYFRWNRRPRKADGAPRDMTIRLGEPPRRNAQRDLAQGA
jgi:hypothetical protein